MASAFRTLDDLDQDLAGKRVLVRVDLNVPMDEDRQVADDTRILRVVPTIEDLCARNARVILLSHFGRPKGKVVDDMSLGFVAMAVSKALGGRDVSFVADCIGDGAEKAVDGLQPGGVALLENLRFHAGEEKNDPDFGAALAKLGDIYVNDAFSASHRAHASVVGIPRHLPAYAGRLMQAELEALDKALENPERPVLAIVGGSKVSTKLDLLGNLIAKVDAIAIGGGMANTFLFAQGKEIGKSLCERDMADTARSVMAQAAEQDCDIILPSDVVVADELKAGVETAAVSVDAVPADKMILDIGPDSADAIGNRLPGFKTVVWNGPVGAFETPPFDAATVALARTTAHLTRAGVLVSVAGGGDTVSALNHAGASEGFTYVSTAGGAFLEWLEGKELPGVTALRG
ncbi:MAG: phosphoglycerate kinase [Rhodospirillaceae bacterium]|nr:phosphoglycerate kinase [Rhodospirillaceae bacterium]